LVLVPAGLLVRAVSRQNGARPGCCAQRSLGTSVQLLGLSTQRSLGLSTPRSADTPSLLARTVPSRHSSRLQLSQHSSRLQLAASLLTTTHRPLKPPSSSFHHRHRPMTTTTWSISCARFYPPRLRLLSPPRFWLRPRSFQNPLEGGVSSLFPSTPPLSGGGGGGGFGTQGDGFTH